MEPIEQLSVIVPVLSDLVDQIEPSQLGNSTPCSNFNVEGVIDHMIGLATSFVPLLRGEAPTEDPTSASPASSSPGEVPAAAFRLAMDNLLAAVGSEGAMERTIASPFGDVPGSVFSRFVAFDGLIHGWDLAVGSSQEYSIDVDVVSAVDGFARGAISPEMRDGDTFAQETSVPDGASLLEALVAFSGRSV